VSRRGARPASGRATTGATPGATAEASAAAARIAEVQAQYPDLQVMLDGMDAPMPMREFLAAVKAEADEMTADAPLLQVAADAHQRARTSPAPNSDHDYHEEYR
jgi:hypothetical protein